MTPDNRFNLDTAGFVEPAPPPARVVWNPDDTIGDARPPVPEGGTVSSMFDDPPPGFAPTPPAVLPLGDAELKAMDGIVRLIEGLPQHMRTRVVVWLGLRYGVTRMQQ